MKYALVGYNKDNDIYGVIEMHEDLEYLKLKGKDVAEIQKATDSFRVDGYKEPFDWFEIVDANDVEYPNVCYWTSYEDDADIDDDMRYNPLKENLTKLLELSEQVLTVAYDNEDNHLEYLAHELKTTIEYMMEDFDL